MNKSMQNGMARKTESQAESWLAGITFTRCDTPLDFLLLQSSQNHGFLAVLTMFMLLFNVKLVTEHLLQFGTHSVMFSLMLRDLPWVALLDAIMYCSMYPCFLIQCGIKNGILTWNANSSLVSVYETTFVVVFNYFASHFDYHWIARVFLLLHSLVMMMKIHSYSFYNGYLWGIREELMGATKTLKTTIDNDTKIAELQQTIQFCTSELKSQTGKIPFPETITLHDFFMFTMYPTLVYQPTYPRTTAIRKQYLTFKLVCIVILLNFSIVTAECSMLPIIDEIRQAEPTWFNVFLYTLKLFPTMFLMCMYQFYLIWDAILSSIAELTMFADRDFYMSWWNSGSILEFCNTWNRPVHKFLLRHCYRASLSKWPSLGKLGGIVVVFVISAVFHELIFVVVFMKWQGHYTTLFLSQFPLILGQNRAWTERNKLVCNWLFCVYFTLAPSYIAVVYLLF